jgi:hypothetical protein
VSKKQEQIGLLIHVARKKRNNLMVLLL